MNLQEENEELRGLLNECRPILEENGYWTFSEAIEITLSQQAEPKCSTCNDVGIVGHSTVCPGCEDTWTPPDEQTEQQPVAWLYKSRDGEAVHLSSTQWISPSWSEDWDESPLYAAPVAQTAPHESEHHVHLLGQALGECIAAAGIIRPDASLSGPELLMFADDLKRHLAEQTAPQPEQEAWKVWQARASLPVGVPDREWILHMLADKWPDDGEMVEVEFFRNWLDEVLDTLAAPTVKAEQVLCSEERPCIPCFTASGECAASHSQPAAGSVAEEAEVVAWRYRHSEQEKWQAGVERKSLWETEHLMTVAQHERIVAAHSAEEFNDSQWWFKELEQVVSNGTPSQRRALEVVRNLLSNVNQSL